MPTPSDLSRRDALLALGAAAVTVSTSPLGAASPVSTAGRMDAVAVRAGRLNQSVARWCFARTPINDLCASAKNMGLMGVDLLGDTEWAVPKQYGLQCTMGNSFGAIPVGFNRLNQHDKLVADGEAMIPKAAAAPEPSTPRSTKPDSTRGTSPTSTPTAPAPSSTTPWKPPR